MATTDIRLKITLSCQECRHRNYITRKNRRNDPDRMTMKKFCPTCGTVLPEQTLGQGAKCGKCGKQNMAGEGFCSGCGAKL